MTRMSAISSSAWCVAPSGPTEIPACAPIIFTFAPLYAIVVRICSQFRPGEKAAYEAQKGIFPITAIPEATDAIDCSAIPTCTKRLGNASANTFVFVEEVRSAASATTRISASPASLSPSPYPFLFGAVSTSALNRFGLTCDARL